jgi:transposase-like protein
MKRSVAADPQRKTEALRLLDQGMGAAEVARRLDVPAGTVRSWAHRAGKAGPPSGADPLSWAERKHRDPVRHHQVPGVCAAPCRDRLVRLRQRALGRPPSLLRQTL